MSNIDSFFKDKVSFSIGTGRCGTRFLQEVLSHEPDVSAVHERNEPNEAFHRYCKWYRLTVDHEGFLFTKEKEIRQDLSIYRYSHEASTILSLSIVELYQRFGARFILLVRSPDRVVNSYIRKGWCNQKTVRSNPDLALGFQPNEQIHHFFGRIVPSGDEFLEWQRLGRVGKLAWYWNALNQAVLEQFDNIPQSHYRIIRLEDLDYSAYQELTQFLGFTSAVTRELYQKIVSSLPNRLPKVVKASDWNDKDVASVEKFVERMASRFGYEFKVDLILPDPREENSWQASKERIRDWRVRLRQSIIGKCFKKSGKKTNMFHE
jgi:hypothetical protein